MAPVTRDPSDPSFPHGTPAGRRRGCPCSPCKAAKARQDKAGRLRRAAGRDVFHSPRLEDAARRHLDQLLATHPLSTVADVARASGCSRDAVRQLRSPIKTSAATCRAVLAVTGPALAAASRLVALESIASTILSLEALGYPVSWQEQRTGLPLAGYLTSERRTALASDLKAVRALVNEVCDVTAVPSEHLTARQIRAARTRAARRGVYPPMCYDDDGALILRSVPGHRWVHNDELASRRLVAATMLLAGRASRPEIAEAASMTTRNVQRIFVILNAVIGGPETTLEEHRDRRRALEDTFAAWDAGEVSATLAALRTGMLAPSALCSDHPDLLLWHEEKAETDRRTHALAA